MTLSQVRSVLSEAQKITGVEWIYFEGGEPFLFYPLLLESARRAHEKGFKVGMVTNAYGAGSEEDAELWLKPLAESGLSFIQISNDEFHYGDESVNPATVAASVAKKLGIETSTIRIDPPEAIQTTSYGEYKGQPIVGDGARFRGRAVEKLSGGLPLRPWADLRECPYEDLESPSRVHIDPYGNVHICQGISMGNMWETPLSELIASYRPDSHPICGPLIQGGPATLAKKSGVIPEEGYIDECHLCYSTRREMIHKFPDYLGPAQVYGLE
jgi:MoaA/NifB/PqqE/SkfB family radical SAM enzyme